MYTHCEEVQDEFSALLDGELSSEQLEAVEAHLSQCADCLRALDGMKQVDNLFTGMDDVRAPEDFEDRVLRTVRPKLLQFSLGPIARRRIAGHLAAAAVLVIVGAGVAIVYFGEDAGQFQTAALDSATSKAVMRQPSATPMAERADSVDENASRALKEEKLNALGFNLDSDQVLPEDVSNLAGDVPNNAMAGRQATSLSTPSADGEERDYSLGETAAGIEVTNGLVREEFDDRLEDVRDAQDAIEVAQQSAVAGLEARGNYTRQVAAAPPVVEASPETRESAARGRPSVPDSLRRDVPSAEFSRKADQDTAESLEKKRLPSWSLEERDGLWSQQGYVDQKTTVLKRESQALKDLIAKYPQVAELLSKKTKVVFRLDDTWYTLNAPVEPTTRP